MNFHSNYKYVELHNHLDGSIKAETISKICNRKCLQMPCDNIKSLKNFLEIKEPSDLRTFLKKFDTVLPFFQGDQEAIAEMCHEFVKTAAESKICYIETRFAPHYLSSDSLSVDSVVRTVLEALASADKMYGVVTRTILSSLRQHDLCDPINLDLAIKYKQHGVVGIDLAGDEEFSCENNGTNCTIKEMFQRAKREGIHRTVHAGENGPVASVREAINEMHAERIGHGYRVLEDEDYYQELKQRNIHFEICPTSSILTGAAHKNYEKHPIHRFVKDKANYSINCDDIMITGRDLKEEYKFCKLNFKISDEEIMRTNINAAKSSFLEEDEKICLLNHLYKEYKVNA